jgi:hypothetical protein
MNAFRITTPGLTVKPVSVHRVSIRILVLVMEYIHRYMQQLHFENTVTHTQIYILYGRCLLAIPYLRPP